MEDQYAVITNAPGGTCTLSRNRHASTLVVIRHREVLRRGPLRSSIYRTTDQSCIPLVPGSLLNMYVVDD